MVELRQQIAEVQRELGLRRKLYPRWVAGRSMTQAQADGYLRTMEAVLQTLTNLHAAAPPGPLFAPP